MQCLLIEKTSKTVTVYPSYPSTFNELPLGTNHISGCIEGQHSNGHHGNFPKSPAGNFGDSKLSIPRLYYLLLCSNQCTHKHHFLAFLILPNKPKKNTSAARRRAVKSTCACVVFVNYGTLNSKSSQTEFSCR